MMYFRPDPKPEKQPKKPKKPLKYKRKKSGELQVFRELWDERERICTNCLDPIFTFSVWNFAHILPKSRRPDLRLDKDNIRLLCSLCHVAEHTSQDQFNKRTKTTK